MSRKKRKNRLPYNTRETLLKEFKPLNDKQAELVGSIKSNEITICKGPSGSGKTYVALATALSLLGSKYSEIILIKSVTTVPEEDIGFLPGDANEKMDPFVMSFTWTIDKICGKGAAKSLMDKKLITVMPISYTRGISIDHSIVIIDEVQNLSFKTFKTLITRIGEHSKYILMGDTEQIDRRYQNESPLAVMYDVFSEMDEMGAVEFTDEDCVRNPLIPKVLKELREKGY